MIPRFVITVSRKFFYFVQNKMSKINFFVEVHDELIFELSQKGWFRYEVAEVLIKYRQHESNLVGYHGAVKMKKVA